MSDFGPWLRNNASDDPALTALNAWAATHAGDWPYYSNNIADYIRAIEKLAAPNGEAATLSLTAYRYFWTWISRGNGSSRAIIPKLSSFAMVVAGLVIAAFLLFGIRDKEFLSNIAHPDQARGLMTFMFGFATTAVIVIVTIGILWVPKEEIEVRFSKAKDIVTVLVTVLGTILGFYFGSLNAPGDAGKSAQSTAATANPASNPSQGTGQGSGSGVNRAGAASPSPATGQPGPAGSPPASSGQSATPPAPSGAVAPVAGQSGTAAPGLRGTAPAPTSGLGQPGATPGSPPDAAGTPTAQPQAGAPPGARR
jgi:hypothetical protein